MKYRFKLEALRQYRQFQEDALKKELSQAMRYRDQLIDVLNNQLKMRTQTEKDLANLQSKTPTGAQMTVYESYLRRINEQIDQQRNQIDQAEKIYFLEINQIGLPCLYLLNNIMWRWALVSV